MGAAFFKYLYLGLLVIYYIFFTIRRAQTRRNQLEQVRISPLEALFTFLAFVGDTIIPLIFIFSHWLDFADYTLPAVLGWVGAVLFGAALWLTWRAHRNLGANWSPTTVLRADQTLVTDGVYTRIRHPIYAARWIWGLAQVLLLWNWIAGLANLICFLPIYFYRVPREEQMMVDQFGDDYRQYMKRTGRVIPKL